MDSGPLPHRNLPLLLQQARELVIANFRPILNQNSVTEQQWRVIRTLLEHGPLEPRQIGAICNILSPSLAGVLARMEQLGLVTRTRMDHDQRRLQIAVTARSRNLATKMAPHIEATYHALEQRLGREFVIELYAVLDRLIDQLDEAELQPPRR